MNTKQIIESWVKGKIHSCDYQSEKVLPIKYGGGILTKISLIKGNDFTVFFDNNGVEKVRVSPINTVKQFRRQSKFLLNGQPITVTDLEQMGVPEYLYKSREEKPELMVLLINNIISVK